MPTCSTTDRIPSYEDVRQHHFHFMLASDSILAAWQRGDSSLPDYIRQSHGPNNTDLASATEDLCRAIQSLCANYPDRVLGGFLRVAVEILGSKEFMSTSSHLEHERLFKETAIHAHHLSCGLYLLSFIPTRMCAKFINGEISKAELDGHLAKFQQELEHLLPSRA